MRGAAGFTLVELLIATAVTLTVSAGVFAAMHALPESFSVQSEMADMHQRARVGIDAFVRDLGSASGVRPYRWGSATSDPPGSFRDDVITAVNGAATTTFWLRVDGGTGLCQLIAHGGGTSADVPLADNVVALLFGYLGDGLAPLDGTQFVDGPWQPDDEAPERWDADLSRVRAIAVTLRVQAASAALRGSAGALFTRVGTARSGVRWAPDVEFRLTVVPRNLNPGV